MGDLWCPAVKELIPELCPQGICTPFGDLIMSLAPPHLVASCIPLDVCDSPFSTLPWHWKHHPSPLPANIISEPIFHTSQELGSKWGQHRLPPLPSSSFFLLPLPPTPLISNFIISCLFIDLFLCLFNSVYQVPTMSQALAQSGEQVDMLLP